ncbi:MAG TPA: hypothetical protein VNY35_06445 [Solirubrobacteraceae bacterium]|nr:hypothetical protein [Solirubrobacteraceae bacterium]
MARHDPGPRRSDSVDAYRHRTRALAALAVLALVGGIVSDDLAGSFWARHALLAGLVASVIVVMLTVALVNEAIERRSRQRWRVLAQYVMLQLVRETRLVWTGLAELAGLMPADEYTADGGVLAAAASIEAGSEAVRDTARLTAALRDVVTDEERRRRLHDKVQFFVDHSDEVLGRWAGVMLTADVYAEVIDRHVELAGDLTWLDSLLGFEFSDDDDRARMGRSHPAALIEGPLDNERLVRSVAAITQLAEQLDRTMLALALRIVPIEWWRTRLGASAPTPLGDLERSAPERSLP